MTNLPSHIPRTDVIPLGGPPVGLAFAVTFAAVTIFGLVPAVIAARGSVASPLRLDVRGGTESRRRRRVRQSLVASQVALAVIMLAGAGLLTRSLARLQRIDLGYRADHLSFLLLSWPAAKYDSIPKDLFPLGEELMSRVRAVPGVSAITPVVLPPFMGASVFVGRLDVEGQSEATRETNPMIPMELGNAEHFLRVRHSDSSRARLCRCRS